MKSRLVSSLLLLVHRYLLVELQKKLFWVVQDALALFISLRVLLLLRSQCYLRKLMVKIITVKQLLNTTPSQVSGILLELRIIQVLPLFIYIFSIEVVLIWWDEGRIESLVVEGFPVEVFQPGVVFHFGRTVVSEPVLWFSLDHFVDEVGGFY